MIDLCLVVITSDVKTAVREALAHTRQYPESNVTSLSLYYLL